MTWTLAFVPVLAVPWLATLAVAAVVVAGLGLAARGRGAVARALALAVLLLALAGPEIRRENREPLTGVVVLVTDRSASQSLGDRTAVTEAARTALAARLAALPGIELREAVFDDRADVDADGTRLFETLGRALADVPPERVAGVVMLTDGAVHDVPADAVALGFTAPLHVLLSGRPGEIDRRVTVVAAPRFGIVGKPQRLTFRVDDVGPVRPAREVGVVIRRDGVELERRRVAPGRPFAVDVDVPHAGDVVIEVEAEPLDGDITRLDDRAAVTIEGIREHLRVLLVSGEPHPGERTWRDLLKSDAAVDLVHFTILRSPDKLDPTPLDELALIAFPTHELFQEKLSGFDLVVFDRYQSRTILPAIYFDNIARWVRDGGALLIATGADPSGPGSLFETPLADVLPATATGEVIERPFLPHPTPIGARHPVTRDLPGAETTPPAWSRWFRQAGTRPAGDAVVPFAGADERPLLTLARRGKGRVALLASDQIWLWARGFEGGGPHALLLRRLAHWLMKEPELEEEALRAGRRGRELVVERRTLADTVAPVTVETPRGERRILTPTEDRPGLWRAATPADVQGLWRVSDGTLSALAAVGPADPREFADPTSTDRLVAPLATATGGGVRRLVGDGGVVVPRVQLRPPGTAMTGADWIGFPEPRASVLKGVERQPLIAGLLAVAALLALFAAAWWRESR